MGLQGATAPWAGWVRRGSAPPGNLHAATSATPPANPIRRSGGTGCRSRRALQQQPRILDQSSLHRGVEVELLQHLLLRMAAAEPVQRAERRPQRRDRLRMASLPVRQHRAAGRQRRLAQDRGVGGVAAPGFLDRGQQALRGRLAARRGERHHPVRLGEGGERVADPRLRLVRQLRPARAGRHALPFQPPQHGRGVLHVDVEIRLRLRHGRAVVAEAAVVEVEHLPELRAFHVEHRAVPPQVVHQVVAAGPVRLAVGQPGEALARRPCISSTWATPCVAQRSPGSSATAARPACSATV
jgi:hypothetical protein